MLSAPAAVLAAPRVLNGLVEVPLPGRLCVIDVPDHRSDRDRHRAGSGLRVARIVGVGDRVGEAVGAAEAGGGRIGERAIRVHRRRCRAPESCCR